MDGKVWSIVLSLLPTPAGDLGRNVYGTRTIVMVLLWSVLHDRPQAWACQAENWPDHLRPESLPHPSTLSRRRRRLDVEAMFCAIERRVRAALGTPARDGAIDSRPMLVGGASKDRDATRGRGIGGYAKGYRAHMVIDRNAVVQLLRVRPMNVQEKVVARELLREAPRAIRRIVGDGGYDSNHLHRLAEATGRRLYAPVRQNRVADRRQRRRVQLARLSETAIGKTMFRARDGVERVFGWMTNLAFGLKPLPPWVRGLSRVTFWIRAKVLFYHAFRIAKIRWV